MRPETGKPWNSGQAGWQLLYYSHCLVAYGLCPVRKYTLSSK